MSDKADDIIQQVLPEQKKGRGIPPVHLWNPPLSGDIDIRVARNGSWFHEGGPIARPQLVKLFSSILKKEGEDYFLVTPVEKWRIQVEDKPLFVNRMAVVGEGEQQALSFHTHVDDEFTLDAEHPLRIAHAQNGEPSPYVKVRGNLEALIGRNVYYQLIDLAVPREVQVDSGELKEHYGVWSYGQFFPLD